jgi:hypothetical protein
MDTETMLRVGAVTVGVLILLSGYVDVSGLIGRLLTVAKKPTPIPVTPVVVVKDEDEQFLHIIDLWHQLRTECEDYGLEKALVAIDKVFPLLNDRIEEND